MSLVLVAPAAAAPTPQPAGAVNPPDGPAQAWLVADLDTGQILGSREPYSAHAPASTIKPLLAMVVLDQLAPNTAIRATAANTQVECSCVGLVPGQVYTARQLLDGLLLVSGNDAANLLADMLGGQQVAVQKMNAKAYQLGARSTRAGSPSGLDGPGWESVTTPHDLAMIYREALRYPLFTQTVHQSSALFPDKSGFKEIKNQDRLLRSYAGFIGGKSGYTDLARETYVGMAQRGGHRLIVVEMYGDDDLWNQAGQLLDWGFSHYTS
ncbi:D-alanyl-D-alanine carboxypeptidase family protein [Mycolicibacterium sp. P1-5]|uniref:D-alanyl-D-alanine carboxypeptidase family protein n=1 Tax=Mycolicibacterium sp. P1-5 TaxID=2024617 RepID=UPI0011ED0FFC|nr:serine hydrolase [Mycolicibacterium sp. P1-5]KAA0112432.1 D-alanyl-D-alanine carboxypeptidase [Mycolicibacterium sp. P1-5]